MKVKNDNELNKLKIAGNINYHAHKLIKQNIKEGISTLELDKIVYDYIKSRSASPAFLNYQGFPSSICASINDEVVHGIPSERKLKNGDIISIDIGVCYQGFYSDSANTYIVGEVSEEIKALVENTEKSLYEGLSVIKDGVKVSEIGKKIEKFANANGLSVIEELVGHGTGGKLHEYPDIPNYETNSKDILKEGMVIAVEPMLNLGERYIYMASDDWTIKTDDEKPSAHFEHTVLVTKSGYQILTKEGNDCE